MKFRASATVLVVFVLVGSLLSSGLCLLPPDLGSADHSGTPSRVLKTEEDCTCRMSSQDEALASNPHGTAAIFPRIALGVDVPAVKLISPSTQEPASFDTDTATPPPKA